MSSQILEVQAQVLWPLTLIPVKSRGRRLTMTPVTLPASVAIFGGIPHAVFLTRSYLAGLDPTDGSVRFTQRWRSRLMASVNAATPIVVDDSIFVSATYGVGAGFLSREW